MCLRFRKLFILAFFDGTYVIVKISSPFIAGTIGLARIGILKQEYDVIVTQWLLRHHYIFDVTLRGITAFHKRFPFNMKACMINMNEVTCYIFMAVSHWCFSIVMSHNKWLIGDSNNSISRLLKWTVWIFIWIIFNIRFSCHPILIRSLHDIVWWALVANNSVILSGCWKPWRKTIGYYASHWVQYE